MTRLGTVAALPSLCRVSVPMLLTLNVAGLPYCGADIGGFFGSPDPELLSRWYQAAVFSPFFRGHAHIDSPRREPWLFGEPWTAIIRVRSAPCNVRDLVSRCRPPLGW